MGPPPASGAEGPPVPDFPLNLCEGAYALHGRQQQALEVAMLMRAAAAPAAPNKGKRSHHNPATPEDVSRQLILESLANPLHRPLTIGQRCDVIGIHRGTWYRHMADPLFRAAMATAMQAAAGDLLGPVLDVLAHSALVEGKDGHQDRKLFLQLHGLVGDNLPGQRRGKEEEQAQKKGRDMTDGELIAAFEGREHLMPPGLLRRLGRDPDRATDLPRIPPPPEAAEEQATQLKRAA